MFTGLYISKIDEAYNIVLSHKNTGMGSDAFAHICASDLEEGIQEAFEGFSCSGFDMHIGLNGLVEDDVKSYVNPQAKENEVHPIYRVNFDAVLFKFGITGAKVPKSLTKTEQEVYDFGKEAESYGADYDGIYYLKEKVEAKGYKGALDEVIGILQNLEEMQDECF